MRDRNSQPEKLSLGAVDVPGHLLKVHPLPTGYCPIPHFVYHQPVLEKTISVTESQERTHLVYKACKANNHGLYASSFVHTHMRLSHVHLQ